MALKTYYLIPLDKSLGYCVISLQDIKRLAFCNESEDYYIELLDFCTEQTIPDTTTLSNKSPLFPAIINGKHNKPKLRIPKDWLKIGEEEVRPLGEIRVKCKRNNMPFSPSDLWWMEDDYQAPKGDEEFIQFDRIAHLPNGQSINSSSSFITKVTLFYCKFKSVSFRDVYTLDEPDIERIEDLADEVFYTPLLSTIPQKYWNRPLPEPEPKVVKSKVKDTFPVKPAKRIKEGPNILKLFENTRYYPMYNSWLQDSIKLKEQKKYNRAFRYLLSTRELGVMCGKDCSDAEEEMRVLLNIMQDELSVIKQRIASNEKPSLEERYEALLYAANIAIYKEQNQDKGFKYNQYAWQLFPNTALTDFAFYFSLYELEDNLRQSFCKVTKHSMNIEDNIEVRSVAFSPDGKYIASGSEDGTAKIWDSETGHLILEISDYGKPIYKVLYSTDGRDLVVVYGGGSSSRAMRIYNAADGSLISSIDKVHISSHGICFYTPDGKYLCSVHNSGTKLEIRDVRLNYKCIHKIAVKKNAIGPFSGSNDGMYVALGLEDGTIKLVEISSGRIVWETSNLNDTSQQITKFVQMVTSLSFSSKGDKLIATSNSGYTNIIDVHSGQKLLTIQESKPMQSSNGKVLPNSNKVVLYGVHGNCRIWDIETGNLLEQLRAGVVIHKMKYSASGTKFLTCSDDYMAILWSSDGDYLLNMEGHSEIITDIDISSDEKRIVTGSKDGTLRIWHLDIPQLIDTIGSSMGEFKEEDIWLA